MNESLIKIGQHPQIQMTLTFDSVHKNQKFQMIWRELGL